MLVPLRASTDAGLHPALPFTAIAVEKFASPSGHSLSFLVPAGDQTYADGNNGQAYIYERLYEVYCRGAAAASPPLVIDVGGLLGDFAIRAAAGGCRVVGFEPQPPYYNLINSAIALNGFADAISIVHAAIGPVHDAQLQYNAGNGAGNAGFRPVDAATPAQPGEVRVPSYRLDHAVAVSADILLLKIDVEGFDAGAVQSAEALLKGGRVRHLFFEFTPFWTGPGQGGWYESLVYVAGIQPFGVPPRLYAIHRTDAACYGPLDLAHASLQAFVDRHLARHLQTDIYAVWDANFDPKCKGPWNGDILA